MRKIKELHVCMPYHRESFVLGEKIKCIGEAPKFEGIVKNIIGKYSNVFIIELDDNTIIEKCGTDGLTIVFGDNENVEM